MSEKRFIVEYGENNLPFFADLEEHRDMSIKEVVDLLNEMFEKLGKKQEKSVELFFKYKNLQEENEQLRLELETHKHPLWSTREAERKLSEVTNNLADEIKKNGFLNEEINQLRIENMRLKKKRGDSI